MLLGSSFITKSSFESVQAASWVWRGSGIIDRRFRRGCVVAAQTADSRKNTEAQKIKRHALPSQTSKGRSRTAQDRNKSSQKDDVLRLNKALAASGVASRRGADELIFTGRISVNGTIVQEPGHRVRLGKDKIEFDGKPISHEAATNKYYFALNKPKGYVCSSVGDGLGGSGDRLVTDLLADWKNEWKRRHPKAKTAPRMFTVGRLDVASLGLIFITNDGDWAQAVQHPSSNITKEYSVTLNRRPRKGELEKLAAGCELDGTFVKPVAVAIDDSDLTKSNRIRIIISEGKNREVRRLVENAGLDVKVLRRLRIGGYRMPRTLGFGEYLELKPYEVRRVLNKGADRTI